MKDIIKEKTPMNREAILDLNDLKTCAVEVPEWQTTVYVRTLSVADVAAVRAHKDEVAATVALVCAACCDEEGKRLFQDQDTDRLRNKSWSVIERIAMKAMLHNALTPDAVEEAKKN